MATGKVNESFAGAIIQFSRSREREEIDAYELEAREDEVAYEADDNFYLHRRASRRLREEAAWYVEMAAGSDIDDTAKIAVARRAIALLEDAKRQIEAVGPFVVWASQQPKNTERWQGFLAQREQDRQVRIQLGNLRRAKIQS
jgi:hypothetical protein